MPENQQQKGPLIVDTEEEANTWSIHPTPGICIKFRETRFEGPQCLEAPATDKFFVNLAHCIEMPPPRQWLDEETVAKLMETDPNAYKIGVCVGELDTAEDHNGQPVNKVDVLVNSEFFHKCISESEFFRQLTLAIVCDMIKAKFNIHLDLSKQVILRNRKLMGKLRVQRVRKRPLNSALTDPVSTTTTTIATRKTGDRDGQQQDGVKSAANIIVEELGEAKNNGKVNGGQGQCSSSSMDIDDIEEQQQPRKPRNFKAQIVRGEHMDIRIKAKDAEGVPVRDPGRLTLKINDDRVVVLLDSASTIADFFLPFRLKNDDDAATECMFDPNTSTLHIKCPIDWEEEGK